MHPVFTNIRFGPFSSAYHAKAVTSDFKEAFSRFLEANLLPQVEQPFESTSGSVMACYDDARYCGPNSIVRDIYKFEFSFHRPSGDDSIKVELVFCPESQTFSTRRNKRFYLWTVRRRERFLFQGRSIQELCERISKREPVEAVCPVCSVALRICDSPSLFDVSCPTGCFNYNYHRDPKDGQYLHGHFFCREPMDA